MRPIPRGLTSPHGSVGAPAAHSQPSLMQTLNCSSLAAELDAGAELLAPLALVRLAPLELALLQGLAADNDLVALVLVGGAGDALEVTLRDDATAAEALAVRGRLAHGGEREEHEHSRGPHGNPTEEMGGGSDEGRSSGWESE